MLMVCVVFGCGLSGDGGKFVDPNRWKMYEICIT